MCVDLYVRRERDRCPDSTTTHTRRQGGGITASARSAAEWVLLHVAEAAMTDLLLLSLRFPEASVTHEHAKPLKDLCQSCSNFPDGVIWRCDRALTGLKAVTVVLPS